MLVGERFSHLTTASIFDTNKQDFHFQSPLHCLEVYVLRVPFKQILQDKRDAWVIKMKNKTNVLATEQDLILDLTLHDFPASLISEFAQEIVKPYYSSNLNMAIQDLINKALSEQEFIQARITHVKISAKQ